MNRDIKSEKLTENTIITPEEGLKTPLSDIDTPKKDEKPKKSEKPKKKRRTAQEKFEYYYNSREQASLRYFKTMFDYDYNKHTIRFNKFLLEAFYIHLANKEYSSFQAAKMAFETAEGLSLYWQWSKQQDKKGAELFQDITSSEEIEKSPFWEEK